MSLSRFKNYAQWVLGVVLLVILWGAYVRASGSGAGCGAHWPDCNNALIPAHPRRDTWIELFHRATSGLSMVMVIVLFIWSRKISDQRIKIASLASLILMCTEALIGAGLVLFEFVAQNTSYARALWVSAHLINTLLLLASLTAVVVFSTNQDGSTVRFALAPRARWTFGVGIAGLLLVSLSGVVTALGDTLFPATSLMSGIAADSLPQSHLFVRLRIAHPIFSIACGAYLITCCVWWIPTKLAYTPKHNFFRLCAVLLVSAQSALGLVNIVLLTPIAVQIAHLLLADILWIVWISYGLSLNDKIISI